MIKVKVWRGTGGGFANIFIKALGLLVGVCLAAGRFLLGGITGGKRRKHQSKGQTKLTVDGGKFELIWHHHNVVEKVINA